MYIWHKHTPNTYPCDVLKIRAIHKAACIHLPVVVLVVAAAEVHTLGGIHMHTHTHHVVFLLHIRTHRCLTSVLQPLLLAVTE